MRAASSAFTKSSAVGDATGGIAGLVSCDIWVLGITS